MEWDVLAGAAGGLSVGLLAAALLALAWRWGRGAAPDRAGGNGRESGVADARPGSGGLEDLSRATVAANERAEPLGSPGLGRRTIGSLRVGVVVLDSEDVPVLINPAARAMGLLRTGTEPGTVAPHPIIRTLAGQVRRTGVRREVELDIPGRNGSVGDPLGLHLRAVGIGGEFIAVEAADVTESHRVARVRRDFVANVSHELKTPIGALQLLAEALLDATESPVPGTPAAVPDVSPGAAAAAPGAAVPPGAAASPESRAEDMAAARRFAERIQSESTRLGRLVNELLELTRLQGAEPLPEPEPVSVDWVLAEVVDRTRTTAAARRIEVVVDGQQGLTVYGSESQVATAVTNLVENAIAYSGEDARVTVTAQADVEHVTLAVTDQGIGIAPDDINRIFERFYRADHARSRTTGGTGLGLAIVRNIAANHGGRVEVSSTLGGGSTFTLRLPARPPDAFLPPPPSVEIEPGPAALG